jgi:carboxypeptidase family protein/TonB-dependent receptor-like protein
MRLSVCVLTLGLLAQDAQAQVLAGTLFDSVSGKPIAGARIVLLDSAGTARKALVTDSDGQFSFDIPHLGEYRLMISRIGYPISLSKPFLFRSAFTARVSLSLPSNPITLDTVRVVTKDIERRLPYLADAGFYKRRQEGFGHFLTRDEIDKRDPLRLTDLLHGMSGVRLTCGGQQRGPSQGGPGLQCTVTMRAANTMFFRGKCNPSVVLDGVLLQPGGTGGGGLSLDDLVNPFNIEALEVYPGPEGVPVQYSGYLSPCGAIVVWSRR